MQTAEYRKKQLARDRLAATIDQAAASISRPQTPQPKAVAKLPSDVEARVAKRVYTSRIETLLAKAVALKASR